jgi:hypothetical protein
MLILYLLEDPSPKMTLYENVGHNSWDYAFDDKNYLKWIYSKSKK